MAKQNQAAEAKFDKKSRAKVKPIVVEELTNDLAYLAQLPAGPVAAGGSDTIDAQAKRLCDRRFQTVQRQALAAQIGQVQGNQHLQRVIAAVKVTQDPGSVASKGISGSGSTLPYKAEMEQAFGQDFSHIRAHTETNAREALKELGARAYTFGSDIALGTSNPNKGTVAHELTHVVQQGVAHGVQTSGATSKNDPAEQEARAVEQAFVSSQDIPSISESLSPSLVAGDWDNPDWALEYRESDRTIVARPREGRREPETSITSRQLERGLGLQHRELRRCLVRETEGISESGEIVFRIRDQYVREGVLHPGIQSALVRAGLTEPVVEVEREVPEATPGIRPMDFQERVERLAGSQRTFQYTELMTYYNHEGRAAFLRALYSSLENLSSEHLIDQARSLDNRLTVENRESFRFGGAFYLREIARILLRMYEIIDRRLQEQVFSPRSPEAEEGPLARLTSRRVEVEEGSPLGGIALDIDPFTNIDLWASYAHMRILPPPTFRFRRRGGGGGGDGGGGDGGGDGGGGGPTVIEIPIADIINEEDEYGIGRRYHLGERKFRTLFDVISRLKQSEFDDRYVSRSQVGRGSTFPQMIYEHLTHAEGTSTLPQRMFLTVKPRTSRGSVAALCEEIAPNYFDQTGEQRFSHIFRFDQEIWNRIRNTAHRQLGRIAAHRQWRIFQDPGNVLVRISGNDHKIDFSDAVIGSYDAIRQFGLDIRGGVSMMASSLNGALTDLDRLFENEVFAQLTSPLENHYRAQVRVLMRDPGFEIIRVGGTTRSNVVARLFRYYASRARGGIWGNLRNIDIRGGIIYVSGRVAILMRVIDNVKRALDQYIAALTFVQQQSVNRFQQEDREYVMLGDFFNSMAGDESKLVHWAWRRW